MSIRLLALVALIGACVVGDDPDDSLPNELDTSPPDPTALAAGAPDCSTPPTFAAPPAGQAVAVTLGGHPAWAHFARPVTGADPTILDETLRLIWSTPSGATIRTAIHSLGKGSIVEALECAAGRGVTVIVVGDAQLGDDGALAQRLVHDTYAGKGRVTLHVCGDGDRSHACFTRGKGAIMHTKLYLFSRTTDPTGAPHDEVVWYGSANMTAQTGAKSFNDTITVYGDHALYAGALDYFHDLAHPSGVPQDYYQPSAGRGFVPGDSGKLYFSPSPGLDLIGRQLAQITPGSDCKIELAEAFLEDSRLDLVKQLAALRGPHQGKCAIRMIGNPHDLEPKVLAALRAADIPVNVGAVHDKYILVSARFGGSAEVRKLVFTGSHNFTGAANNKNDELLAQLDSPALFAAYEAHFAATWAATTLKVRGDR